MKQSIVHVALVVRDYDEAIRFYTEKLHFTVVEDTYLPAQDKRWVVIAPPGSDGPTLLLARASTTEQERVIGNQTGGRVFLFLSTDDFWRDYHAMISVGIAFVRAPKVESYGTVAVFEDLYGNLWDLVERSPAQSLSSRAVPATVRTARMLLRSWSPADAPALAPILEANVAHLGPWIPAHVATPAPVPRLVERLTGFAADFAAGRAFRYALVSPDESQLLGEAALFPRAATGRVSLGAADHVELGYWLDAAVTGRGLATEATRALFDVAAAVPGMSHVEIRCDRENARSAALPQRLGFHLAREEAELQIWRKPLNDPLQAVGITMTERHYVDDEIAATKDDSVSTCE